MSPRNSLTSHHRSLKSHDWFGLAIVWVVALIVLTRQMMNDSLGYPDADRILMDGVFLHDFLRDLPLDHIYDYTVTYFAQYPALSIGYRPPFFPLIEALFNLMFGVNMWSSRLALLVFALVGLTAWFLLVRRIYDLRTAVFTCLLFITLPFVAKWGWYTMAELPLVSMAMLTGYLFYRYAESEEIRYLYFAAIAFVLTVWTKQTAFYLVLWMLLFLLVQGKLLHHLKQKHVWVASLLVIVALIPLAVITLWLGDQNLVQSLGSGGTKSPWQMRVDRFMELPGDLISYQLTTPALVLSVLGISSAVLKRDKRALYFGLLILATLVFFAYVVHKTERYTIFWLPAFALFAALPFVYFGRTRLQGFALGVLFVLVIGYQVNEVYQRPPNQAKGYREAAAFVLENSRSPVVFVDAYNNGYFSYFMRALDDKRSMYVLRADKLLTSSSIASKNRLQVHAENRDDIKSVLDQYGVDLIVVESEDLSGIPIHKEFRSYLKDGPFSLEGDIAIVQKNRPQLDSQRLLIYRYKEMKRSTAEKLVLPVPVVGKTIEVPWVLKSD